MSFLKFGLDDIDKIHHKENESGVSEDINIKGIYKLETDEITIEHEKIQSFQIEEKQLQQRKPGKCDFLRRKSKDLNYKECKDDLNHLFYIKTKAQERVRHSFMPDLNAGQIALEKPEDLLDNIYPHCSFSEISPIYFAKKQTDSLDICFTRTRAHACYNIRMSHMRTRYLNTLKSDRKLRKLEKDSVYSHQLFKFSERLESNPDPYFYRNYDIYYTGGNLCVLPTETHNMLHVDGSDFSTLKLSTCPLNTEPSLASFQECITKKLMIDTEIFEICPLETVNDKQNLIAVRQKNHVTIFNIEQENNQFKSLIELKSETVPFISLAQTQENPELLVVSNMKQRLHVYDVGSSTAKVTVQNLYKMENPNSSSSPISWNRIKPLYGQTFVYANERQLCLVDFRASQEDWLKTECSFSSKEFPCEFNSSLAISEFNNLLYIGTTHKLRCVDTRYLNQRKNYENVSLCEWTHELDYSPAFLDVLRDGKYEYIACASPLPGDTRICELTKTKHLGNSKSLQSNKTIFKSHCLAWQPPTLQEAYENACISGKVLQPQANLKKRIEACTTGLAFLKTNDYQRAKAFFIQANSNGDVYAQMLQRRQEALCEERTSEKSDQIMSDFSNELSKLPQPQLNYTDIVDMKALRKVVLCPKLRGNQFKIEEDAAAKQQAEALLKQSFKGRWQKSMSTLHTYKDALAKDLLSIWDIPYEDETDLRYSMLKTKFESQKSEKDILNWLNHEDNEAPTTSIPISNLLMTTMDFNTTETNDTSFEHNNTSGLLKRNAALDTMPVNPKIAKTKKKHVKGF